MQKLEDAVITAKKLSSQHRMQLNKVIAHVTNLAVRKLFLDHCFAVNGCTV